MEIKIIIIILFNWMLIKNNTNDERFIADEKNKLLIHDNEL